MVAAAPTLALIWPNSPAFTTIPLGVDITASGPPNVTQTEFIKSWFWTAMYCLPDAAGTKGELVICASNALDTIILYFSLIHWDV